MDCPVCKEPMIVLDYDAIEVDYCVTCAGVWLDAGELELLFGDAAACAAFLRGVGTPQNTSEKPRRCPICDKNMDKAATPGENPVTYDQCPVGDGLWFDRGELGTVLVHGLGPARGERLAAFLRDVFGGVEPKT